MRRLVQHPSWLDLKLGFRLLARYPGLTLVGGISIAFAVAVGAVEFVRQLTSPTLPLLDGDRIVGLRIWDTATNREEDRTAYDLALWRSDVTSLEGLGAFRLTEQNLIVWRRTR